MKNVWSLSVFLFINVYGTQDNNSLYNKQRLMLVDTIITGVSCSMLTVHPYGRMFVGAIGSAVAYYNAYKSDNYMHTMINKQMPFTMGFTAVGTIGIVGFSSSLKSLERLKIASRASLCLFLTAHTMQSLAKALVVAME